MRIWICIGQVRRQVSLDFGWVDGSHSLSNARGRGVSVQVTHASFTAFSQSDPPLNDCSAVLSDRPASSVSYFLLPATSSNLCFYVHWITWAENRRPSLYRITPYVASYTSRMQGITGRAHTRTLANAVSNCESCWGSAAILEEQTTFTNVALISARVRLSLITSGDGAHTAGGSKYHDTEPTLTLIHAYCVMRFLFGSISFVYVP